MYGGGGGQWPGQQPQQQQPTGYMQPQATGYMGVPQQRPMMTGMPPQQQPGFMGAQPTGMMQPQATGMGMGMGMGMQPGGLSPGGPGFGGMRQPSYGQPSMGMMGGAAGQQRFLSPQPMQMQPTGMMQSTSPRPGLQPQMTGYPGGGMMGMQPTGLMPQMTGLPLDPRMQLMSAQFLPSATPFSGAPMASNMNFSSAHMQPSSFQSSIQNLSQQQQGSKEPKIPWALSKDERKSYDQIFRAWDQKNTGFLNGEVAIEVFGQSGLDREKLMQVWHLSDTENRGKLNLAEFHVAMALIYRALNGNDLPEHLPQELVPPSAKDLSDSVDFLKDLLKRDANVRQTTALNLPESGSNNGANYGKSRSFHENPIQKQDAAASYKHTDEVVSTGYKSSARHLDRRTVRYGGETPADDLSEMKRQLANTQRMLENQEDRDDDDNREIEKEMDELRFRIKNVQDDIDYYNRRSGRDAAESRRKAERELLHLMHERLPQLERRLEEKDKKKKDKALDESRDRDRRNESYGRGGRYDRRDDDDGRPSGRRSEYSDYSRSHTPTQRDQDRSSSYRRSEDKYDLEPSTRTPPPPAPAPPTTSTKPAPPPPAPPAVAAVAAPAPPASTGPPKNMTPEERQAWIRSEAQRRIEERKRALGAAAPPASVAAPQPDTSVEQRLAADKAEAEQRSAQADAEANAREEARRARLEEQRLERERAAVSTIKSELKQQEKSDNPPPKLVMQAAREEVDEQEEMLRRREEVLKKEAEERKARFKKLEEEEEEARRQEESFKQRQAQFQGQGAPAASGATGNALPAPVRKGKSGPPPPPPTRSRAAPPAPTAPSAPAAPPAPVAPAAQASSNASTSPSAAASTNPFHRMQQQNGSAAPTTPGGSTNPFFRSQGAATSSQPPIAASPSFDLNLPAPQRTTAAASAPQPPATVPVANNAPTRRAPDDDDDWGESEHGDQDDDDPDGPGSTSRATRQNLAAALFSNLVPTPPTSASPAPQAPAAPPAPAPPAPPAAPPAPSAPSAPPAPIAAPAPAAGPADVGALLGQIRGGLSLRKAQTNDRSGASTSGKVMGDASAPVQRYIPPPSPPAAPEAELSAQAAVGDESAELASNPNRQSVDWANHLAADQMHAHTKASAAPDEPSVREEDEESEDEGPEDADATVASHAGKTNGAPVTGQNGTGAEVDKSADSDEFDLSQTIRVRTLYAYDAQRDEDVSFVENSVILAHPAKDESNDWWFGSLVGGGSAGGKGTFPRAYVQSIDQPKIAKALYDFEGSSPEEMNFSAEQTLHVVDDSDENWWKVVDEQDRILIVPSTYVELVTSDVNGLKGLAAPPTAAAVKAPIETAAPQGESSSSVAPAALSEPIDDQTLSQVIRESEKDERERKIAVSREEKDLLRAIERSKLDVEKPAADGAKDTNDIQVDDDDGVDSDSSGYSTTGWTSSSDDDDDDDDEGLDGKEEDEEAQKQRVVERIRLLEAAGILVIDQSAEKSAPASAIARDEEASKEAENRLLRRKSRKPKPERPERTIGQQRGARQRPSKPARPPPPPPKEREPEEQMVDAYDRLVKLTKQIHDSQKDNDEDKTSTKSPTMRSRSSTINTLGGTNVPSATPPTSASPGPSSTTFGSVASAGSGLFNSIKSSMTGRRTSGATSPPAQVERNRTPSISGPMKVIRTDSPALASSAPSLPSLSESGAQLQPSHPSGQSTPSLCAATWGALMGADVVASISEGERKRQESIFELITTESTHVRDVQIIVNVFFNAMQPLLAPRAATVIFANVEEVLLAAVSLLSDLEARQRSESQFVTRIGDILQQHLQLMTVYIPYCVNQETASHILTTERQRNAPLDSLLVRLRNEHPSARGLDLSHFLLAPMQRITRYPLLIGQILKYTVAAKEEEGSLSTGEKDDDDETKALRKAMKAAQKLLDTTNEAIRQRQSDERLAILSERINFAATEPSGKSGGAIASSAAQQIKLDLTQQTRWMGERKILREEVLMKQKSGRRITLVLCNDIVLLMTGSHSRGATAADQYLYRMPMPLEELVVRDCPSGITGRDDLSFQLVHQGREKINLRCTSARACHSWMHSIDSARQDCLSIANKVRRT